MKSILIIEDEVDLSETYEEELRAAGYDTKTTTTIEEIESLSTSFQPALLLVDHGLSGGVKNGIEAIAMLKQKFPNAAVVIFSNYNESNLIEEALQAGADEYWVKISLTLKQLLEKVDAILK